MTVYCDGERGWVRKVEESNGEVQRIQFARYDFIERNRKKSDGEAQRKLSVEKWVSVKSARLTFQHFEDVEADIIGSARPMDVDTESDVEM